MEKKNQFKDDLKRVQCKRGKLLNGAEKVPEKQKEVAKTTEYAVGCITQNKEIRKRWIMQDCENTTFTTPSVLAEIYDEQIRKFGFRNKTEVLVYLAVCLWNKENGIKNNYYVRRILDLVSIERSPALCCLPRDTKAINLKGEEKDKVLSLRQFGYLSNLMNALLEAFIAAKSLDKRLLRKEMHAKYVKEPVSKTIGTYISENQYDLLYKMAKRAGTTIQGLINLVIEAMLTSENLIPETWFIPFEIQDVINDYLRIDGFTFYKFKREISVDISMKNETISDGISRLIFQYKIPGANELVRRAILFLLNSGNIPFRHIPEEPEENELEYFDENEVYTNERISRKDFVRSIYQ